MSHYFHVAGCESLTLQGCRTDELATSRANGQGAARIDPLNHIDLIGVDREDHRRLVEVYNLVTLVVAGLRRPQGLRVVCCSSPPQPILKERDAARVSVLARPSTFSPAVRGIAYTDNAGGQLLVDRKRSSLSTHIHR